MNFHKSYGFMKLFLFIFNTSCNPPHLLIPRRTFSRTFHPPAPKYLVTFLACCQLLELLFGDILENPSPLFWVERISFFFFFYFLIYSGGRSTLKLFVKKESTVDFFFFFYNFKKSLKRVYPILAMK